MGNHGGSKINLSCQRKIALDKNRQRRFNSILWKFGQDYHSRGERLNSTTLKLKAEEFLSAGVSKWLSTIEHYGEAG